MGKGLILGHTSDGTPIYLTPKQRSLHMQVVGASGRGKSKFIEGMIRQDILNNNGLCLIDPHGYLYNDIVKWCTAQGMLNRGKHSKKILLFDPTEVNWTFGYNPLPSDQDNLSYYVEEMVNATAKVWGANDTNDTPLLNKGLTNIYHVLAEQGLSLLEAKYLINPTKPAVRKLIAQKIKEEVVKNEWDYLNELKPVPFQQEFGSTINRMNNFLKSPAIKNTIGQTEYTINFKKLMDEGYILLVNLGTTSDPTKRKVSDKNAQLLGTLMINEMYHRSKERPEGSKPFYLYIDECSYFINNDIERILVECRKFGLHMTLAHQTLSQLRDSDRGGSETILQGVMSGAQNKVIFGGMSVKEAKEIAEDIFIKEINLEESIKTLEKPVVAGYDKIYLKGEGQQKGHVSGVGGSSTTSDARVSGSNAGQSLTESLDNGINPTMTLNSGIFDSFGSTDAYSNSWSESEIDTKSHSVQEALQPVLKIMPSQVHGLDKQIFKKAGVLVSQKTQHAIIRKAEEYQTHIVKTPLVKNKSARPERISKFKEICYLKADFSHETTLIEQQIQERHKQIEMQAQEVVLPKEPKKFRG